MPVRKRRRSGSRPPHTIAPAGSPSGGNLGGITSGLLGLDGGAAAGASRLDIIFPVGGRKRFADFSGGFEFTYPAAWLQDITLLRRQAARLEARFALDPPPVGGRRRGGPGGGGGRGAPSAGDVVEPAAAFGPPGSTGEENVSVVAAPIFAGFDLASLGSPTEAAERLLLPSVAPPGSGKTAALLAAGERRDAAGVRYYAAEFTVRGAAFFRHNLAVYAARDDTLFTFNAVAPEDRWGEASGRLAAAAASFRLIPR